MNGATRAPLSGGRWHFQHGPIDLVIGADGDPSAVACAHEAAWQRFGALLPELVTELAHLKRVIAPATTTAECCLRGSVARRMWLACHPYRTQFITSMAAVAGGVADELIACYRQTGIRRAYINNGGDIALHLTGQENFVVGLFSDLSRTQLNISPAVPLDGRFVVPASWPVRGVATSGWRGRSFSLGIADSVTVLAASSAQADAAATVIANAVDIDHAGIVRRPADQLKDDSDLGHIPVTVDVPVLTSAEIDCALSAGEARARELQASAHVFASAICLQGRMRIVMPAQSVVTLPIDTRWAA